jgi:hypothetical protein
MLKVVQALEDFRTKPTYSIYCIRSQTFNFYKNCFIFASTQGSNKNNYRHYATIVIAWKSSGISKSAANRKKTLTILEIKSIAYIFIEKLPTDPICLVILYC